MTISPFFVNNITQIYKASDVKKASASSKREKKLNLQDKVEISLEGRKKQLTENVLLEALTKLSQKQSEK